MISGNSRFRLGFLILALAGMSTLFNIELSSGIRKAAPSYSYAATIPASMLPKLTLGYQNGYASILWIETIAYYGELLDHSNFHYIARMLKTITVLNPHAEHAYYMGATILPWGTQNTLLSKPLLHKAMQVFPDDWRWPYYRGFNAYWFDNDTATAAKYLTRASQLPNSPLIIASLAARMQSEGESLHAALIFLTSLAKQSRNALFQKQLKWLILKIKTEQILRQVDDILKGFNKTQRNFRKLHALGIRLPAVLPDGGHIIFDSDGTPVSSKEGKRFKVYVPAKRKH